LQRTSVTLATMTMIKATPNPLRTQLIVFNAEIQKILRNCETWNKWIYEIN